MYTTRDVTVCIKTFERPHCLAECVKHIRKRYPDIQIIVVDDSNTPGRNEHVDKYLSLPYDSGLSAGRNFALKHVSTPLAMIIDDDTMFIKDKCIENMLEVYNSSDEINLVAGRLFPNKRHEWHGKFIMNDDLELHFRKSDNSIAGHAIYDFVINLFIADTKTLQENPWREELKIAEHTEWFWRVRDKMKCTICDAAMFKNTSDKSNPEYAKMRQRKQFWKKQSDAIGVRRLILKR